MLCAIGIDNYNGPYWSYISLQVYMRKTVRILHARLEGEGVIYEIDYEIDCEIRKRSRDDCEIDQEIDHKIDCEKSRYRSEDSEIDEIDCEIDLFTRFRDRSGNR